MPSQRLVDEIIEELYRRLELKVSTNESKKKLVLIGPVGPNEFKEIEKEYSIINFNKDLQSYDAILITRMTVSMLGHLAVGCSMTSEEDFILHGLLKEKPVYVLEEGIDYKKYKKLSYKALYTLFMDYEEKIKQYGIRCISHVDKILYNTDLKSSRPKDEVIKGDVDVDMSYKKLLLEADLIKMHIEGLCTLKITKKCIITPLADDYIRKHHIKIQKV